MSPLFLGMASCQNDDGGIVLPGAGNGGKGASGGKANGSGGSSGALAQAGSDELAGAGGHDEATSGQSGTTSTGGKTNAGGTSAMHAGGSHATGGFSASAGKAGAGHGGTSSNAEAGMGGEPVASAGAGDATAEGGAGGSPDDVPKSLCIFHSAPSVVAGGEGGGAPAPNGVAVATNAFVGPYLTDLAGLALYIYGADVPGDCNNPPVSNCTADCLQSWPLFDAGERQLDATLDPSVFGTIDRGNGVFQTTYYGWPLYRYKSDTAPNVINGQGKGKTWFAAEVELPNLMIMRGPVSGGGIKYLSDDRGRTLYSLSGDTLGGTGVAPKSACTGDCLDAFTPFAPGAVYPVTSIEPHDVALFFRADGSLQTAYKGAPLYYAKSDERPGTTNGLTLFGGALVAP